MINTAGPSTLISGFLGYAEGRVVQGRLKVGPYALIQDLTIDGPVALGAHCLAKRSQLGRYTVSGDHCRFIDCDFGGFCSLGDNVMANAGEHPIDWVSTNLFSCNPAFWEWSDEYRAAAGPRQSYRWRSRTTFGHDVWIGNNVVVRTGVSVGTGAVIGANSIVTKDVPPYTIVAGNPARRIRQRFDDATAAALLASEWWTLPLSEILQLPLADVHASIADLNDRARKR